MVEKCARGLNVADVRDLTDTLRGTKIKTVHLNHWRKVKGVGPPANHIDSSFDLNGNQIMVQPYFESTYGMKLKYPQIPTINIGTAKKPMFVPAELCLVICVYIQLLYQTHSTILFFSLFFFFFPQVPSGQIRSKLSPEVVAEMIKHAAVLPDVRQV